MHEAAVDFRRPSQGDSCTAKDLLPLVYDELRKLAAAKLAREPPGPTLEPTALVHEAWLRLGGDYQSRWSNRAHFFAAAAEAMRRILVENARWRRAARHGGGLQKVSTDAVGFDVPVPPDDDDVLLLHEAIDALGTCDTRKAEIVKQCFFRGLTQGEIADVLGISRRTVQRDLTSAKAWLAAEITRMRR